MTLLAWCSGIGGAGKCGLSDPASAAAGKGLRTDALSSVLDDHPLDGAVASASSSVMQVSVYTGEQHS